jgi:AbiV family abortive infection protein
MGRGEEKRTMSVTSEYLVKGYALALEQCGLLLRDAVRLYEDGSYATAVVLAAFAREELGRSKILLDLWRNQRGGQSVTVEQIDAACGEHVDKQRAGMLSMTMRADRQTGLGKILTDRMTSTPQSQKRKDADAALKQIDDKKARRTPDDRHSTRMRSLYVEPSSSGWNRPADMAAQTAHDFLQDAVNDYSLRYSQGYIASVQSILKAIDADLYNALEQLADRPQLPPPVQPSWPTPRTSSSANYARRAFAISLSFARTIAARIWSRLAPK